MPTPAVMFDSTFTIGATLRLSFRSWFRNFIPFTVLSAIVYLPLIIWALVLIRGDASAEQLALFGGLSTIIAGALNIVLSAALTYGVVMELRDEHATIGRCIVVGLLRFFPVIGVWILMMLAIFGASLLLIIPGIIVTCMLYVAVPASIVERPGILGALRRSRHLTYGRKWKILGLYLLSTFAVAIVAAIVQHVFLGDPETTSPDKYPAYMVAEIVRLVVLGPLAAVIPAVAYFLLRQEKEGASVAQLARVFD